MKFSKSFVTNPFEPKENENWANDITELEYYFKTYDVPTKVKLNECTFINDSSKFLESHFAIVKANNGNKTFLPYQQRLIDLKKALSPYLNSDVTF